MTQTSTLDMGIRLSSGFGDRDLAGYFGFPVHPIANIAAMEAR